MTKLTVNQAEVLGLIRENGGARGTCVRYVWTFQIGTKVVTREVHQLENKGFVQINYYAGGNATALAASQLVS